MRDKNDNIFEQITAVHWGFAQSRILSVATKCGILDELSKKMLSANEVARNLKLDPFATGKMIRALHSMKILLSENGNYYLHPEISDKWQTPESPKWIILHSHNLYERWGNTLEGWLRNKERPSEEVNPGNAGAGGAVSLKKSRHQNPDITYEDSRSFAYAMQGETMFLGPRLVENIPLENPAQMLDLGGSFGHLTIPFLKHYTGLKGTIVDTENTIKAAKEQENLKPFLDRIEFIANDYHTVKIKAQYDLVLLANIIHQEDVKNAELLVKNAASFLKPNGILAIQEFSIDENKDTELFGCLFAVNMGSFGDTYSFSEISSWMSAARLKEITKIDIAPRRCLIQGRR